MVLDGQLLLEEAMRLKPDVIVSDISMPAAERKTGRPSIERIRLPVADCLLDGSLRP